MPAIDAITPEKRARSIGLRHGSATLDGLTDEDSARDVRLLPGFVRRGDGDPAVWAGGLIGRFAVMSA